MLQEVHKHQRPNNSGVYYLRKLPKVTQGLGYSDSAFS